MPSGRDHKRAAAGEGRNRSPNSGVQGKHGVGGEGENGNIMLLLDAAQELHRSSSGDEGNGIEPSTAGTGVGE